MSFRFRVMSVNTGVPAVIGEMPGHGQIISAIRKSRITGPAIVTSQGLRGDHQVDQRPLGDGRQVHGGRSKALYAYTASHHPFWSTQRPEYPITPGCFGENLTILDLDETKVRVDELWGIGGVILQVSEPRRPCFKLDLVHGPGAAKTMQDTGYCGWYLRVLLPGRLPNFPVPATVISRSGQQPTVLEAFQEKMARDPSIPGPPAQSAPA